MIILRLQGLPWSATAKDIRQYFEGLSIPDGGVHIIGGEEGDVFIAFVTDDDARKAMQRQKQPLNGSRVILMLSSKTEMQEVIAESRAAVQSRKADPFGTSTPEIPPASQADQHGVTSREGSVTSSHSQGYQGPGGYQGSGYQSGNVSAQGQSYSQGYETSFPPSQGNQGNQGNQGFGYDQSQTGSYKNYQYHGASSTEPGRPRGGGDSFMYDESQRVSQYNEPDRNIDLQRRQESMRAREELMGTRQELIDTRREPMDARRPLNRDQDYQHEPAQYGRQSRFSAPEDQRAGRDVDKQYQAGMYGSGDNRWSSDRDNSFPPDNEKSRPLLPSPSMSGPGMIGRNERRSLEPFENPMEGVSTSYPPAGPPDRFAYSQVADKDQRGTRFSQEKTFEAYQRPLTQQQQGLPGYDKEAENKANKPERGRYGQGQFGDDYWVAESSPSVTSSQPVNQRKQDDFQRFPSEGFKPETQMRSDVMQNQRPGSQDRMNQPSQPRNFPDDKPRYGSSNQEYGSYFDQQNQPKESFNESNIRSSGYSTFPKDVYQQQPTDFDSRMGNEPTHDQPQRGGPQGSFNQPGIPSLLDPVTADAPKYGSNEPSLEFPHTMPGKFGTTSQFYAVRLTGLPFNSNEKDVRQFLHGINVCPHGVQFHRDSRGYSTGTANVKVEGPHDLDEALKRHRQYIGKRYIDVRPCLSSEWEKEEEEKPRNEQSGELTKRGRSKSPIKQTRSPLRGCNTSIEIRGLSYHTKNAEILDFFQGCKVKPDGVYFEQAKDGPSNGIGYVEFADPDQARKAYQRNGKQLGRRSVSIRMISKEILDAKISVDMKKKSERRSPGKRSPDRRRGSSPSGRRGRSPGRRGRGSPSRSSSRSSPGRNGPAKRTASPSKRDKERESRSGKRDHSPSRHSSQERKGVPPEKKDRRGADIKEGTPTSSMSTRREDSKGSRSEGPKQDSSVPLLQSPDLKENPLMVSGSIHQEPNRGQGLLKTPGQPTIGQPNEPRHDQPVEMQGRPELTTLETAGRSNFGRNNVINPEFQDGRGRGPIQDPNIGFQRTKGRVSRFDQREMDQQPGEGRQGPVEGTDNRSYPQMHDDHRNSRQGQPGVSERGPWNNREELGLDGARNQAFSRFMDDRQELHDSRRGGLVDNIPRGMDDSHGERRGRPVESRSGGLLDNWQGSLRDDHMTSERKQGSMNKLGPMSHRQGEPHDERQRDPIDFNRGGPIDHPGGSRRTLLQNPDDEIAHGEDRDLNRRAQGVDDRRGQDEIIGRSGGAHPRDHSPNRWMGDQQDDNRTAPGGFGMQEHPGLGRGLLGRGGPDRGGSSRDGPDRGGPGGKEFYRNHPDADRRNFPSHPGIDRFPNEEEDRRRGRMGFEGAGPRDHPGPRERQFGPQERPDRRSMEHQGPEEHHGPGDFRECRGDMGPREGDQSGPPVEGEGEYVCAHVRNVPYQARWPEIAQFFSGLKIVPGGIHIMISPDGKPNGHCFIEFINEHQARLTEERRLQPLRDRRLQINACSKAMMIRALEQGGELQQARPQHQHFQPRGHGPGPRGPHPGFHGNPRGPFPGPGPRGPHFGPDGSGPHQGGHGLHHDGLGGPHHGGPPGPRHRGPPGLHFDGPPGPHRDRPGPHRDGHPQHPFEEPRDRDVHRPSRFGPGDRHSDRHDDKPGVRHGDRSRDERSQRQRDQPKESPKLEKSDKAKETPKQTPTNPEPQAMKESEVKKDPKPPPTQSNIRYENHKGCVISATNLPVTITVDSIKDFFKGFETVKGAIKIDTNETTGKATGEAKIVFVSPAEANRAIKERNNRPLNGRIVRLHVV